MVTNWQYYYSVTTYSNVVISFIVILKLNIYFIQKLYLNVADLQLIYLARNAKDVCVSMYHFMRKLRHWDYKGTFQEFYELFIKGQG